MKLPALCAQLTSVWSKVAELSGPGAANGPGDAGDVVAAGVRHTIDLMVGPYLANRGKKRFCNKDLGTEQQADGLVRVYPEAKFICLYRHPMDMIASGIEACPWGLNNYGFEPYVAANPGNTVLALASYWTDHTSAILAAEERFTERCHRVRYEDLVASPDSVAGEIFDFLGVRPVKDISARCFSLERERSGPGDYKIWTTSGVSAESVGRSWSVPANLVGESARAALNELAEKLGYVPVGEDWGTGLRPADLRLLLGRPVTSGQASSGRPGEHVGGPMSVGARLVGQRLQRGLSRLDSAFRRRWRAHARECFLLVAMTPQDPRGDAWWLVNLAAGEVSAGTGAPAPDADWVVAAPADGWEQVIRSRVNLGVAFRRLGMRYSDNQDGPGSPAADIRVAMMSELLGMNTWQSAARDSQRGS